jgi:predicted membrane protein
VSAIGFRAETVSLVPVSMFVRVLMAVFMGFVFAGELMMARLVAQFAAGNGVPFYREHQIVGSAPKMLTDGLPIFGDNRDLHARNSS